MFVENPGTWTTVTVTLWCCQSFGLAESSQDMGIAAIACGLPGVGWWSWKGLLIRE